MLVDLPDRDRIGGKACGGCDHEVTQETPDRWLVHPEDRRTIVGKVAGGRRVKVTRGIPSETKKKGKGWNTGDGSRRADNTYP